MPFIYMSKYVHFKPVQVGSRFFNAMFLAETTLPKGFGHKVPKDQDVIQLEYGYKKGGIVTVYETTKYGPGDAKLFLRDVLQSGGFRDREREPGFTSTVIPNPKLFVVACSVDKNVLALAVRDAEGK